MREGSRKFVGSVLLVLFAGVLVGFVYDRVVWGLLAASLVVIGWQAWRLTVFERALQSGNFGAIRYGDGIWQQLYSRFRYERERGDNYKNQYNRLIREIRKSTDAMPDGAIVIDEHNEVVSCNRSAKSLVGIKRKKDRGQRVDNILRDPAVTRLLQVNDATESADFISPLHDDHWLNCRIVPYGAKQRLVLIRDVTDRIRVNRIRRDFVANASHELRSPLTVISGYLESIAEDDQLDGNLAKPIAQMRAQARRMETIITDLLELSRLESSGAAADDEAVPVPALIHGVQQAFAAGDSPDIRVQVETDAAILGVTAEIESVLYNLVSNAVRHTAADGQIEISWSRDSGGAELLVRDSGEGIATEHLPRLTERFFRVDRGRARHDGGFGLGLAIVKHVLERHDAELSIASEPGKGSEFRCRFPAQRVAAT